jgi:hypothetical protein
MTLMHVCTLVGLHSERRPQLVWPTHPALTASCLSATFPRRLAQRKSIDVARVRNLLVSVEVDPFMKISWLEGSQGKQRVNSRPEATLA